MGPRTVQLSAGASHTCAVSEVGDLQCFGDSISGNLGVDQSEDILAPSSVPPLQLDEMRGQNDRHAVLVSAGFEHTCVVDDRQDLRCFGSNSFGELGQGSSAVAEPWRLPPVPLPTNSSGKAVAVACGQGYTVAVLTDGTISTWGRGGPHLGRGPSVPVQVRDPSAVPAIRVSNSTEDAWAIGVGAG